MRSRFAQILSYTLAVGTVLSANIPASAAISDSHMPRMVPQTNDAPVMRPMDPKNVPDFVNYDAEAKSGAATATGGTKPGTALKAGLQSATLPVETRMRLIVEYPVSATSSVPGDIFEGHVRDDLTYGRTLILPRGSLVRGRITEVSKPRLLSRAGKIGLKLDQIVTPTGEVIPLDATLEFKKGTTNKSGQLDPGTNLGTRVESSVRTVAGMNEKGAARGAIVAANIATLGAPIVATAIGSSAIALFRAGDDISLSPGQDLEILLTNALGVQVE